jgi:hypothetical protein
MKKLILSAVYFLSTSIAIAIPSTSTKLGTCLDSFDSSKQIRFQLQTNHNDQRHESRDGDEYSWISQVAFDDMTSKQFGEWEPLRLAVQRSEDVGYYELKSQPQNYLVLPDCRNDLRRCSVKFLDFEARLISTDQNEQVAGVFHCFLNQ